MQLNKDLKLKVNKLQKNIPNHWKWVNLDDIGIVISGGTPSTKEPDFWNGEISWVTPADLSNFEDVYISKGQRNISQIGLEYSSAILLPENSIIFSSRAPIGYVAITKNELATNQGFKNLILPKIINPKFVYYYLKTVKELAESMASGTTFLELSATKFKQIPFPITSIEEQNRIVEQIEELFSQLNNSSKELIKSKELTHKLIKKTIFNLFDKIKKSEPLYKLAKISMGQSPNSETYNNNGNGMPFFQGKKEFGKMYPVIEKWTTNPIRIAKKNDVLMSVRAPVGDVNIATLDCCIGRGLCAISFNGYHKFLFYYLDSIKNKINSLGTGSTFNSISKEIIEKINIPSINFDEQVSLINELESKIDIYENIIIEIDYQILNNENLKSKILLDAFQGKLSKYNEADTTLRKMLNNIKNEKKYFLIKQEKLQKNRIKITREKKSLVDILKLNFKDYSFSFEDVIRTQSMSTNDLENEFNMLLQSGKLLKKYDKKSKSIKFTLI